MKAIISFICCILILSSCQDEVLNSQELINDEWSEKNSEIREAEKVIEVIMNKYNAHSYKVIGLQDGDPPQAAFFLQDYKKNVIKDLSVEDHAKMATAIIEINSLQKDMSMLQDVDEVFTVVEEPPAPKGGMESYVEYLTENLRYPKSAREAGIEGKVWVEFVVNDFGEITEVKAIKGIGGGCDEAAAEVVRKSAPWIPGKQRGEAVKVRMVIPIHFKIGDA